MCLLIPQNSVNIIRLCNHNVTAQNYHMDNKYCTVRNQARSPKLTCGTRLCRLKSRRAAHLQYSTMTIVLCNPALVSFLLLSKLPVIPYNSQGCKYQQVVCEYAEVVHHRNSAFLQEKNISPLILISILCETSQYVLTTQLVPNANLLIQAPQWQVWQSSALHPQNTKKPPYTMSKIVSLLKKLHCNTHTQKV